jgi:hypothetical protein
MCGQLRGFVVTLTVGLAVAACGSGAASLQDVTPLPTDAVPVPRPAPKFSATPSMPAWRHFPESVTAQQFNQDKAKCTEVASSAPGVGSPELKFYLSFTSCMHSEGYEAISGL